MTNQSPSNCAPAQISRQLFEDIIAEWDSLDPDFDIDGSPTLEELFYDPATKTYNIDWSWLEDHIEEVIEVDKACQEWCNEANNNTSGLFGSQMMVWHYEYFKYNDGIEALTNLKSTISTHNA